jgi:hypothetical protein
VSPASAKPATVRFYFDADVLGLAKVLARLRPDITYPGDPGDVVHKRARPACPITSPAVLDPVWIPRVTERGWLIVTRDHNIALNRAEIDAVRTSGARMVALAGREAVGTWAQLEVFMSQWRAIEALTSETGPFIYSATRTRLRPIPLA